MAMLGKRYADGDIIVQQDDVGDCMYVVQHGQVEVIREDGTGEVRLAVLQAGDVFGEMALIERQKRSATVRALGEVRVMTLDRKAFLRRVQDDPSLAFRILESMSHRIRTLDQEVARLQHEQDGEG